MNSNKIGWNMWSKNLFLIFLITKALFDYILHSLVGNLAFLLILSINPKGRWKIQFEYMQPIFFIFVTMLLTDGCTQATHIVSEGT